MDYVSYFIEAKYHMSVANRMIETYDEYPEKRVLVGVINESAKACAKLVKAALIFSKTKGDLKTFEKKVADKFLDENQADAVLKILEIYRAQKKSPIEFSKESKIILMVEENYKILTVDRLKEFIKFVSEGIRNFGGFCRQI